MSWCLWQCSALGFLELKFKAKRQTSLVWFACKSNEPPVGETPEPCASSAACFAQCDGAHRYLQGRGAGGGLADFFQRALDGWMGGLAFAPVLGLFWGCCFLQGFKVSRKACRFLPCGLRLRWAGCGGGGGLANSPFASAGRGANVKTLADLCHCFVTWHLTQHLISASCDPVWPAKHP